jgi:hypothetical protein
MLKENFFRNSECHETSLFHKSSLLWERYFEGKRSTISAKVECLKISFIKNDPFAMCKIVCQNLAKFP